MPDSSKFTPANLAHDLTSGLVVFLVALPLCLGIALASEAPLFSGLVAGVVGGIVVGMLSGSHTSVSGPAAGLTAIVIAQLQVLSFEAFLLAVVMAGVIQVVLGLIRAGFIAAYFPSSVIKGLLAAIGLILILKQIPHLFGHDTDYEGEMEFFQPDQRNTFSELIELFFDFHAGAALIGVLSLALLIFWDRIKSLKRSVIPAPLVVVIFGVGLTLLLRYLTNEERLDELWAIEGTHLVQVPVANSLREFLGLLTLPDFTQWQNLAIFKASITIALVASLETLLNLEAVDKIDPRQRNSPPSRELVAQGVGNIASGMLGGLPVTSVVVRGSVNVMSGSRTKFSAILHGVLLLVSVVFLPVWLNLIPLSCLAAILIVTGAKLASPKLVKQMWQQGKYQFIPFVVTVLAIVFTDLLTGILIGLGVSISFILASNLRRPTRRIIEKYAGGEVLHIELANQVSFLNRAALTSVLDKIPRGGKVLIDAHHTDYIDPDVLDLIRDFKDQTAPARDIEVSIVGFRSKYHLEDQIHYVDYTTRELQNALTPDQVMELLREGNKRFRSNKRLRRDFGRLVSATAQGQHPFAVILSCIDSRAPAELVFDMGLGDIFSVRIAGNITSRKILGSIEYGCAVAGAKLVVVLGHTRCGAVTSAVNLACSDQPIAEATGCQNVEYVINDIKESIDVNALRSFADWSPAEKEAFVNVVARAQVQRSVHLLVEQSDTLARLVHEGRIAIVGGLYDVTSGEIEFLEEEAIGEPLRPMQSKA